MTSYPPKSWSNSSTGHVTYLPSNSSKFRATPSPNMDIDEPYTLALFCDSSETAMAACVYVCSTAVTRRNPRLLAAKTRLAPLKKQSVPRLELCAMCLGAKLVNAVQAALSHSPRQCDTILAFTDSTVALAWVASESARWKTFVANRVQQIHTALPGINWLHVPTDQNPADLGTRSASPPLNELKLWLAQHSSVTARYRLSPS